MADFFGAIAAGEIGSKRLPLVFPEPTPKNGILFPLKPTDKNATPVYKKPSTREDLDAQIENLKQYYAPFLQKLSPAPTKTREIIPLKNFSMREQTEDDLANFSRGLLAEGDW